MSTKLMLFLLVVYITTAIVSGLEKNWPRMLYWISAGMITISVIWMGHE